MNLRERQRVLRQRIVVATWVVIAGLVVSGATALPLQHELDAAARVLGADGASPQPAAGFTHWVIVVRNALHEVYPKFPFFGYGTDWLGFAHFMIAIAFVGVLRHPLRNCWLLTWGLICCILVLPWALIAGDVRGVPLGWRLIDCSFGVFGAIPCWLASRWCRELEQLRIAEEQP